jgi:hypothetical protein
MWRYAGRLLILAVAVLMAGCGPKGPPKEADIAGRVEDAEGKPVAKMSVRFQRAGDDGERSAVICVTQADGKFDGRCLPGNYEVTVRSLATEPGKKADAAPKGTWEIAIPDGGKKDIVLRLE